MKHNKKIKEQLVDEILKARERVYTLASATPLDKVEWENISLYFKREDQGPIHAYKWRGAYNFMASLSKEELAKGVVAASAGNHAQGVALSAKKLGAFAKIYMPLSTPRMKINAVRSFGGDAVEIQLIGDTYDEAYTAAKEESLAQDSIFVHPYDDIKTMGGQGTIADEIVMSGEGPFDYAFLQIGGGGMAAAVSLWLKFYYPKIKIFGVEGIDQASMGAAIKAGKPTQLDYVDVFCDGTAVKKVGDLTHPLCAEFIDEFITVSNEAVCSAMQFLWEQIRCVPEPAGALGLAGLLSKKALLKNKKVLSIICGANMDFSQLSAISKKAVTGSNTQHSFRFKIKEQQNALLQLLQSDLSSVNIINFQYGKTNNGEAWPIIGFELNEGSLDELKAKLQKAGQLFEEITANDDVVFGIIPFNPQLVRHPHFIKLEFHERSGALIDFLKIVPSKTNICYFNYRHSGERVGRAIIGFESESNADKITLEKTLGESGQAYRYCHAIKEDVLKRILY